MQLLRVMRQRRQVHLILCSHIIRLEGVSAGKERPATGLVGYTFLPSLIERKS